MACAACDHVQRIWINLLISWHRIEWQVPNVWISWKWEKWNKYHCSFHFGYLFGLDLAIGRPWYRAACKKMPCQTKRQGLNCRCLGYRCLVQRQYQKGSPALDWKSCLEGIWCNDFFAMWFLASWNDDKDFVNIYEQWWREMQDNYHHTTHMIQYALSLLLLDPCLTSWSWPSKNDGIMMEFQYPSSRGRSRKTMGFEVITSISPFLVILWGMIWASLIKGSQLEDEAWPWNLSGSRQVESFLWDIVDIRRNLLKKVSSEISLGGGDQT